MQNQKQKTTHYFVYLVAISLLITACNLPAQVSPSNTPFHPPETNTPPDPTPTPAYTPSETPTPDPLTLFLVDPFANLLLRETSDDIPISDDPNAPLWFGPSDEAPTGEILQTATWVFALAAPFPTLADDISLDQLQSFWLGDVQDSISNITKLYVPESLDQILSLRWGAHSPNTISVVQTIPDPDTLWDENAWAILPFELLSPKLKVIRVAGLSPLFKDFTPENYPLTVQYELILNQNFTDSIPEATIDTLVAAITPTNRNSDKMTTLVMTGVTALVRATAYKMEIKGVLYPGEEIAHWLTSADLTHISNEVSFYEDCPYPDPNSRKLLFCSSPDYIELFEYIGADIIELTGNHNNDALYMYGIDVVPFTLDLYQQRGMVYFGGGRDLADAMSPAVVTHNGNQLAFIGCNAPGPDFAWATETQGGAAPCGDFQWMAEEISRLKSEGFLPIATFQYYEDYYNFAAEHHQRDFGLMAEAGAVIVNGSQAHRPKGMAFEQDTFIDYGLGNLFFDQMGIIDDYGNQILQTRWEIIQRHTFYEGRYLSTELLTAMLEDYAQPRPMTHAEREVFLDELFTASGWNSR